MDKEKDLLNGNFSLKALLDASLDKNKGFFALTVTVTTGVHPVTNTTYWLSTSWCGEPSSPLTDHAVYFETEDLRLWTSVTIV